MLYSKQKTRAFALLQYWKAQLKQVLGNRNIAGSMKYQEQYLDQVEYDLIIEQIRIKLEIAKQELNLVVKNRQEIREREIMDFYYSDIGNETEKEKKKWKKVMQQITKAKK